MKITDLLIKETIDLDVVSNSKEEVINYAVDLINKSKAIDDIEIYRKGVFFREKESTTGIGEGVAIPHCKSSVVSKPFLSALVIKDGVDFDSLDGEKVKLLFLIAAPESKDNIHLEVLARLSTLLMDLDFKEKLINAKTKDEFLLIINKKEEEKLNENKKVVVYPKILCVTGCPTGIAHTYMAEEALKKAADKMNITIKVETNGSSGVKNILTKEEIENAEGIVIASDTNVEMDRFNGKRVVIVPVSKGIHEPEKLIKKALDEKTSIYETNSKNSNKNIETTSKFHNVYKHLMNGVSHMLPFVIGGGILIALAFLVDTILNMPQDSNFGSATKLSWILKTIGGYGFSFMLPILSGYIAYSIAGRAALAVGIVGGYIANQSNFSIQVLVSKIDTNSNAGFLGAICAGFIAGYIIKLLEKGFNWLPKSLSGIKPTFIYPLFGILLIGIIMLVLNTPFAYINIAISNCLNWLGEHQLTLLLGTLLAGMMAIDMGGPINKAAYVFGTGLLTVASNPNSSVDTTYCYQMMASVMIGGMVPPLGIAISSLLFPSKYTKEERKEINVNYIMGLAFITEGAIPYASKDPFRVIPSCVIGSSVAGLLSVFFGCTLMAPHGGIFVFAVVGNWYLYLLSLLIGSLICGILIGLLKKEVNN